MTLNEYLKQKDPVRYPCVVLKKNQYKIAGTHTIRGEQRSRVYIITKNPLIAGIEYCLIGKWFYATDSDGNPKGRSVFSI